MPIVTTRACGEDRSTLDRGLPRVRTDWVADGPCRPVRSRRRRDCCRWSPRNEHVVVVLVVRGQSGRDAVGIDGQIERGGGAGYDSPHPGCRRRAADGLVLVMEAPSLVSGRGAADGVAYSMGRERRVRAGARTRRRSRRRDRVRGEAFARRESASRATGSSSAVDALSARAEWVMGVKPR